MADVFTKKKRSQVMSAIRGTGNKDTELVLAKMLRRNKIKGWRRNQPLVGRPDFTFQRERVILFVDGCFWHFCPKHGRNPGSNQSYWTKKLARNKKRDRMVARELRNAGWQVVRIWEHELANPERIARRIQIALRRLN